MYSLLQLYLVVIIFLYSVWCLSYLCHPVPYPPPSPSPSDIPQCTHLSNCTWWSQSSFILCDACLISVTLCPTLHPHPLQVIYPSVLTSPSVLGGHNLPSFCVMPLSSGWSSSHVPSVSLASAASPDHHKDIMYQLWHYSQWVMPASNQQLW